MKVKTEDVRVLMLRRGYPTIKALAEESGIKRQVLGRIISNKVNIGGKTIDRLCQALNCTPNDIIEPEPVTA